MRRLTTMLLAGALLAPLSLAAQDTAVARPGMPRMRMQAHRMGPMDMGPVEGVFAPQMLLNRRARLELTDEQVKQLEALSAELKQVRDKAQTDAKPHREKLAELWKADQPDVAALQAEMRALMQARQNAALTATAATAKAKGLLTAEQRGRVEGWADARGMMMRGRMFERRMGPGVPGAGYRMNLRMRREL